MGQTFRVGTWPTEPEARDGVAGQALRDARAGRMVVLPASSLAHVADLFERFAAAVDRGVGVEPIRDRLRAIGVRV